MRRSGSTSELRSRAVPCWGFVGSHALLVGAALLGSLALCAFAPVASAEQVSYQQVTPVGPYEPLQEELGEGGPVTTLADVAANGASVFFSSNGPFPGLPPTGGRLDVFRASRAAGGSWSTTWMSPGPDTLYQNNTHDRVFEAASADGTKIIFESSDQLDPSRVDCGDEENSSERGLRCYQRVYEYDSSTGLTSLISRAQVQSEALFSAVLASASPDLATVSWLTPEAMSLGVEDQNSPDVYVARDDATRLVSAPSGSTTSVSATRIVYRSEEAPGVLGPPHLIGQPSGPNGQILAFQLPARDAHLISADGSEAFFEDVRQLAAGAPGPGVQSVYMRRGTSTTLLSSAAQRTVPVTVAPSNSYFSDATPDGRSVFFETASQLTNGDGNASVDVYRYDVPTGQVSLVSAVGNTETVASGGTGSYYLTNSADGSHVYIASRDDLDPNSAPAGSAWKLYERVEGRTRFIALVPELSQLLNTTGVEACGGANTSWDLGEAANSAIASGGCDAVETIRATVDGSRLLFESAQALTPEAARGLQCITSVAAASSGDKGETQIGATPGQGCNIYSYDDATGAITLLSPGASGYGAFLARAPFPDQFGQSAMTAPLYQPALMSADGASVFFSSKDVLVPGAVAGLENIYRSSGGALTLISPPNESANAIYDGNSADGSQVFFHSRQSLIPGAENHGQFAIYDAQLGDPPQVGPAPSAPQPVASAPAQTLTVNAAAVSVSTASTTPPLMPTKPKSLTRAQELTKALRACGKDRSRSKRFACEKSARKTYGSKAKPRKSKKATSR